MGELRSLDGKGPEIPTIRPKFPPRSAPSRVKNAKPNFRTGSKNILLHQRVIELKSV
jgi:hypothetical protein